MMVKIGDREVATGDAVLMGTGGLMLIDGFLPWYGIDIFTIHVHVKGFSSGFTAWLGILLIVSVGAAVAARVFAGRALPASTAIGPAALVLAVSGLGTLLVLLRLLSQSSATKFGLFVGLLLAAAQTAYAFLAFRASGEPLPTFGRSATPPVG